MSKAIGNWFVPTMWKDGECWIIGGGSSVPRQFGVPEKVIQEVLEQKAPISTYNSYLEPLHIKHVIGTNIAYKFGHWISVLYFGDLPFYRNNMLELHNFKNLKVTDTGNLPRQNAQALANHRNIRKLVRSMEFGLSEDPKVIRWNHNAGAGAINLAVLFGARRIMLLGFDMKANGNGQTHFVNGIAGYYKPARQMDFDRYLQVFPQIAVDAKRLGVEILNVSEDSAIEAFPKVKLKDVL